VQPVLQPGRRQEASSLCDRLLDEAALIDRVRRGDENAARSLVERLRPIILKCIRCRLPRWASEDDLVQSVFAKIFSHLHQFSGAVPIEHWVARITVNTSLSQIAYESIRPEWSLSDLSEEHEAVVQNLPTAGTGAEERDHACEVLDLMLARLRPEERRIVVLLHIEQRSALEISRMLGVSVSSVKVKAFRTRHKMRRLGRRLLDSY
jgi:RNA polymerase sigma-70 factor (ECF subfamily)